MTKSLHGVIPPMTTPFRQDGEIDLGLIGAQIDWLCTAGVHGVAAGGSTGEGHTLDHGEYRDLVAATVAASAGRLPVVAGISAVSRQILAYSWAMVICSLLLGPVAGTGWFYDIAALALGAYFLREAHGLARRAAACTDGVPTPQLRPMRLFHASITYLTLLFVAVGVDPFLRF